MGFDENSLALAYFVVAGSCRNFLLDPAVTMNETPGPGGM